MESVMEPNMPADGFFDLLNRGLDFLCNEPASLRALKHFEKELCKIIGIFHHQKQAHRLIESAFGRLPRNRDRCLNLLEND
jgi:DNA repair protein RecO (recombination protein O)